MGQGIEVYNDQGKLQLSSELMQYYLHSKGSAPLNYDMRWFGVIDVQPPGNSRPTYGYTIFDANGNASGNPPYTETGFIAYRCSEPLINGGAYTLSANSPVCTWYRFEPYSQRSASATNLGFQTFNASGQLTFDIAAKPLVVVAVHKVTDIPAGMNYRLTNLPVTRDYAYIQNKASYRMTGAFNSNYSGAQLPPYNARSSAINIAANNQVRISETAYETSYAGSNMFDGTYTIIDVTGY